MYFTFKLVGICWRDTTKG